jgi:hypothetical protein
MNALEVPVTNCPVGMNEEGLPIGIQVFFHQLSFLFVTLFLEARSFTSSTTAKYVTTFHVLPTYHWVTGLRVCYCETDGCHSGRHLNMKSDIHLAHCTA